MATQPEAMNVSGAVSRGGRPPRRGGDRADATHLLPLRPPTTIPPARPPARATHTTLFYEYEYLYLSLRTGTCVYGSATQSRNLGRH